MLEELEKFFEELTIFIRTSRQAIVWICFLLALGVFGRDVIILLLLLSLMILPPEFWIDLAKSR